MNSKKYLERWQKILSNHARSLFCSLPIMVLILAGSSLLALRVPTPNIRALSFPADFGKHPDFRGEWWYVSGHLDSQGGQEWGYHFAIFRYTPLYLLFNSNVFRLPAHTYWGHLSVTDKRSRQFMFCETSGLEPLIGAGADLNCLHVWVDNWKLRDEQNDILLRAADRDVELRLRLSPVNPPVLHGHRGLVRPATVSGPTPPAYYFSLTSVPTRGLLKWKGKEFSVTGESWLDRQFWTGTPSRHICGWDWFGLNLDNGYDIMLCMVRLTDGRLARGRCGTIVRPNGTWHTLMLDDFQVRPVSTWKSDLSEARYPMGWRISVPEAHLELEVSPVIEKHEIIPAATTRMEYWEGPVSLRGKMSEQKVTGQGYVELTGYSHPIGDMF